MARIFLRTVRLIAGHLINEAEARLFRREMHLRPIAGTFFVLRRRLFRTSGQNVRKAHYGSTRYMESLGHGFIHLLFLVEGTRRDGNDEHELHFPLNFGDDRFNFLRITRFMTKFVARGGGERGDDRARTNDSDGKTFDRNRIAAFRRVPYTSARSRRHTDRVAEHCDIGRFRLDGQIGRRLKRTRRLRARDFGIRVKHS